MWLWWEGSGNYSGRACGCGGRGVGIIVGEHVVVVGGEWACYWEVEEGSWWLEGSGHGGRMVCWLEGSGRGGRMV